VKTRSRILTLLLCSVMLLTACTPIIGSDKEGSDIQLYSIDHKTLLDKMEGGWVGQMAGVAWGGPTEFSCQGEIMEGEVSWKPRSINDAYKQDDLYVELPFMDAMKDQGVNASWTIFGDYFKSTKFMLWHANDAARTNLLGGIAAPDSGHYRNNLHADDIDWQIEADFAGIITPGQPEAAIDIAWRAGHVMNYGDGVYGGVAMAAMHSAAYFAKNVDEIIEAGRQAVPEGSEYRQVIEGVIAWHQQNPTDWKTTWRLLEEKWGQDDRCPDGKNTGFNIDAKLNGAYVFMGLLYGQGDFKESMRIAMHCGQDSDCNTSSVGGILGNWLGLSKIPEDFKSDLSHYPLFSYTSYDYKDVIKLSEQLARRVILKRGGSIEGTGDDEVWNIPISNRITPPILEQWPEAQNDSPELTIKLRQEIGNKITLTAKASDLDGISEYQWYFGDLSYAAGAEVSHTYLSSGTYEVIGYVSDQTGNTTWKSIQVDIGK
jgi:ADP-ribosylglycohydrolase